MTPDQLARAIEGYLRPPTTDADGKEIPESERPARRAGGGGARRAGIRGRVSGTQLTPRARSAGGQSVRRRSVADPSGRVRGRVRRDDAWLAGGVGRRGGRVSGVAVAGVPRLGGVARPGRVARVGRRQQ